jgi:hypothetical protein
MPVPEVIVVDVDHELVECAPCSPADKTAGERNGRKKRFLEPLYEEEQEQEAQKRP